MPRAGEGSRYLGPGTLGVAATFLDPRTGEVVDEVAVGDTLRGRALRGVGGGQPGPAGWVAVTSGLATTVLDARTREVVARIDAAPGDGTRS